jgi:hypothetical protein
MLLSVTGDRGRSTSRNATGSEARGGHEDCRPRPRLREAERQTAANEMHQALQDLSRRPSPDLTGALQHALAALESAMRDACGDHRATLGQLLAKYPGIVPRPLDQALEKMWGFASEQGRHLNEFREPKREEVVLVVEVAAATISYVAKRLTQQVPSPGC